MSVAELTPDFRPTGELAPLIQPYGDTAPDIHETVYVAPGAVVIGDVSLAAYSSVFHHCVLRGDIHRIEVGEGSNIQDLTMLHVADEWPCIVGSEVTVGHCALLHGCVVHDGALIGMGAKLLNGSAVGRGAIIAAGSVLGEGVEVPPGKLAAGVPARIKGDVTASMLKKLGAMEEVANTPDIPEELRGLPGVPFARKYRKVAKSYLTGRPYRPNLGLDPD